MYWHQYMNCPNMNRPNNNSLMFSEGTVVEIIRIGKRHAPEPGLQWKGPVLSASRARKQRAWGERQFTPSQETARRELFFNQTNDKVCRAREAAARVSKSAV